MNAPATGWQGQKGPFGRNVVWTHPQLPGVEVRHCGHPTALRPYYLAGVRYDGRCFRRLVDAQAVAMALRKPAQQVAA